MGFSEFVLIVASIMALNPLALDLMLPAQPDMAAAFKIADANRLQAVLSVFLLGFGLGQFIVGPLSDRFGRRGIVLIGLAVYSIASLAAILAPSFEMLLLARLLQGFGTSATRVIATSIVRDCYGGRRMASVMSLAQMVFITVPIVAPSLGQLLLVTTQEWRVVFIALLLYGLIIMVWCALRLPETLASEKRKSIVIAQVLGYYRRTITTRQTIGYAIAAGAIQGAMFSYLLSMQQVFSEYYHLGRYFTVAFAVTAIGFLGAGFFNSRFVGRLGMRVISHAALVGLSAVAIMMIVATLNDFIPLWLYMVVATCTTFGFGLTFANFTALAMEPQGEIAGTASSLFGSITILLGIAIGSVVGQAYDGTIFPLAVGFFLSALGALAVVLLTEKGRLFKPHNKPI